MRRALTLVALVAGLQAFGSAQQAGSDVEVLHIRGPLYLIAGGGGNVVASVGPDGVLVTDTGSAAASSRVLAEIQRLQQEAGRIKVPPPRFAADAKSGR